MNIQQFCMAVNQQPPPNIYAPSQQQPTFNNRCNRCNDGGHGNGSTGGNNSGGGGNFLQQPTWFGGNGAGAQQPTRPPTPYKHWKKWNYCQTHGGDADDTHTSPSCGNRGPTHNVNATRANIMGGSIAGMHKTILPSACDHTPVPSSSSVHSNTHQRHTTLSRARARCNLRTVHARDEFCRTAIPSTKSRERADDAAASSTGDAHDGTLLCSQPTTLLCPQPAAARILLTSRGGQ